MKTLAFVIHALFVTTVQGQFSCNKVRLYDQMVVRGDKPMLHKLKPYDMKLLPDTTFTRMNKEIIKATSPKFFSWLKMKSVKLCDSARARAWAWTNPPIVDRNSNPVYFFYAVLFEMKTTTGSLFIFRVDVLKNGELLDKKQIAFFKKERLNIIDCKKVVAIVSADTIQPINLVDDMALAYSPEKQSVIWLVNSVLNSKTGIQHHTQVDAFTGTIVNRAITDMNVVPEVIKID